MIRFNGVAGDVGPLVEAHDDADRDRQRTGIELYAQCHVGPERFAGGELEPGGGVLHQQRYADQPPPHSPPNTNPVLHPAVLPTSNKGAVNLDWRVWHHLL